MYAFGCFYVSHYAKGTWNLHKLTCQLNNKKYFIEQFEEVKRYFGQYAEQFLDESEGMVQLADDQRFRQQPD